MLTSTKLRRSWYQKVYFLKLNMCLYLPTKFEVSSIILTSFKQGRPSPIPKWTSEKPTPIRLKHFLKLYRSHLPFFQSHMNVLLEFVLVERNFLEGLLEEYSELCQASEIEFYVKIVNEFMQFTILEKSSILDIF